MRDYVTVAFDTLFKSTVRPIFKADIQARYSRPIEKSDIFIQGRFKNIPHLLSEILFADGTLEWFFTCVNPFMLVQITQYPEGLVTLWHSICLTTVFIMNVHIYEKTLF